jgi:hypothetical protein
MPVHGVVSGLDGPALWEAASNTKTQNVDNVSLYKHPFNSTSVTLGQNCSDFAEAVFLPDFVISVPVPKSPGHMENFMISGSILPEMKPLGWLKGDYFLIHIPDGAISIGKVSIDIVENDSTGVTIEHGPPRPATDHKVVMNVNAAQFRIPIVPTDSEKTLFNKFWSDKTNVL